jgi:hypothetical protein
MIKSFAHKGLERFLQIAMKVASTPNTATALTVYQID